MRRKRVIVNFVGDDFKSAMQVIDRGNVYVSRYPDGDCILVNNRGTSKDLKFIMFDPESCRGIRTELDRNEFENMFTDILSYFGGEHYEIVENGDDMIEKFASICAALMALETRIYKGYRVRRYTDE